MQTLIPPPVYMLLFAGLMWLLDKNLPIIEWVGQPWNYIGLVLIALAIIGDLFSLWLFYKKRTTPNPLSPEKAAHLVTNGLYQYTRNPMYVGMLVMLSGWGIYLGSLSPFFAIPAFILTLNEMQIKPEEKVLEEKFGQSYLDYKQQVRRWL